MGPKADLGVLVKPKISCPWRESNPGKSSLQRSHTNYAMPAHNVLTKRNVKLSLSMSSRHIGGVDFCPHAKLISIYQPVLYIYIYIYIYTVYIYICVCVCVWVCVCDISFMYESETISSRNVHLVGTEQHLVGNNNSGSLISRFRVVEHR